MISPDEIQEMILQKMPRAQVRVSDMTGTGDHFDISVTAAEFRGKTLIEQHQMIHAILAGEMDNRIHAVQLKTRAAVC